jgi:hypothetical protein
MQEVTEWAALHRLLSVVPLVVEEGGEAALPVDAVRFRTEDYGVSVECKTHLVIRHFERYRWRWPKLRCGGSGSHSLPYVLSVIGQEKINVPGCDERCKRATAREATTLDVQAMVLDRREGAEREVWRVLG